MSAFEIALAIVGSIIGLPVAIILLTYLYRKVRGGVSAGSIKRPFGLEWTTPKVVIVALVAFIVLDNMTNGWVASGVRWAWGESIVGVATTYERLVGGGNPEHIVIDIRRSDGITTKHRVNLGPRQILTIRNEGHYVPDVRPFGDVWIALEGRIACPGRNPQTTTLMTHAMGIDVRGERWNTHRYSWSVHPIRGCTLVLWAVPGPNGGAFEGKLIITLREAHR